MRARAVYVHVAVYVRILHVHVLPAYVFVFVPVPVPMFEHVWLPAGAPSIVCAPCSPIAPAQFNSCTK